MTWRSFRGRVIPADLEAKIIDAKQKVSVTVTVSLFDLSLFNQTSPHLMVMCVGSAGLCATVCECHSWFNSVRCIWPHQWNRRHLWEVQLVAPCWCELLTLELQYFHSDSGIMICLSIKVLSPQGAWGGGLLMSRKHRHKLSGVER